MASRGDAVKKLQQEMNKLQKLRHDEKAWKAQHKNVQKADKDYQRTFERGN